LDKLIDQRLESGQTTAVVSIHSFTPAYHGVARPWHVGVISKQDRLLADALLQSLAANVDLCIGDNLPYGPDDGVYHSLQRHGEARGLRGAMIEVRNDLLDEHGQKQWAYLLNEALSIAFARTSAST
jgi:predicted N-formylglutamate amidohydrolase